MRGCITKYYILEKKNRLHSAFDHNISILKINNNPEITIIITTRNRNEIVSHAVESVFTNTYDQFRLIVLDQSTDNKTTQSLNRYTNSPIFTYLKSNTCGAAIGRNIAIQNSETELIGILDDDCVAPVNWIISLINAFLFDEKIGIVFGNVEAGKYDKSKGFIPTYLRDENFLARNIYDKNNVEGLSACMGIRKSVWKILGGFDPMLGGGAYFRSGEESDLAIKALLKGIYVYECTSFCLTHNGFRVWEDAYKLIDSYWYGTGATFAKYCKCNQLSILFILAKLGYKWAFQHSRVLDSLGTKQHRLKRLRSFCRGFYSGLRMPVDKKKQLFIESQKNSGNI